jgi:hypothetical protein
LLPFSQHRKISSGNVFANQGNAAMKKKSASVRETPKNAGKSEIPSTVQTEPAAPAETKKPTSAPLPNKSQFKVTKEPAKKMSISKPAAATSPLKKDASAKKTMLKKDGTEEPRVEVTAATLVRRTYTRKKKMEVPAILLEGDTPSAPSASGPGEKFSLGSTPSAQTFSGGELPDSYGTKKLFLTARDPHWLYATWDLTIQQQKELNAASTDGHLILRIYGGKIEGHPAYEIHVHPESRHWFAHVERAGSSYTAELGYYSALGKWMRVAVSSSTLTPPDAASSESEAEFATIPFELPFAKLMQIIEEAVRDNMPLAAAIEELRRHGHPDLPRFSSTGFSSVAPSPSSAVPPPSGAPSPSGKPGPSRVWTPEQEKALAKVINIDQTRRIWMGSLEITELIRRRLAQEVTSPVNAFGAGGPGAEAPSGFPGASSPMGGEVERAKNFWFNVNAELIIYGATEPNAKVTLGGHEIKLRSDGTFSFRFALPDGKYDLPAVAVSADGTDGRAAELRFSRCTEYLGDVGATPQDPALNPPQADSL